MHEIQTVTIKRRAFSLILTFSLLSLYFLRKTELVHVSSQCQLNKIQPDGLQKDHLGNLRQNSSFLTG